MAAPDTDAVPGADTPRARTSLRARAVAGYLRLQGMKRFYADPAVMRRELPRHQSPHHTRPPTLLPDGARARRTDVDGHPAWTVEPPGGAGTGRHVLHLHGGGFVEHPAGHHWRFAARLAAALDARVTLPVYPLVPGHDHHTIRRFARHCYEHFLGPHRRDERLVSGDSAGGALALSLAQGLRDRGEPRPARIALFSPWLDLSVSDPLARRIEPADPALGVDGLRQAGRWYAADTPLDDPEISPAHADLSDLGRVLVLIGTHDVLLPDARMLHRTACAHGQHVELHEFPRMFHNWLMHPVPEARPAHRILLRFLGG